MPPPTVHASISNNDGRSAWDAWRQRLASASRMRRCSAVSQAVKKLVAIVIGIVVAKLLRSGQPYHQPLTDGGITMGQLDWSDTNAPTAFR